MKHWIKALDPAAPTNVLSFARGLNGPVATEFGPDGSLLVLNRGAIWRDPKQFVPNAGSLIRIRYVGSGAPLSDPAPSKFTPALGLPADATQLPRTLARADWETRFRGAKRWALWLNNSAWQPAAYESIDLYLPPHSAAKLLDDTREIHLPAGAVVLRNFSVTDWQAKRAKTTPEDEISRLIETRLLVVGAPRGYGASYRWKSAGLAELIEDGDLQNLPDLVDDNSRGATPRKVSLPWWFPGVDDGITFPITNPAYWVSTAAPDFILPPAPQYPENPVNWLRDMHRARALETTLLPEALDALPRGSMWRNLAEPAEARVRSYLHGNCAVCHQPGGASRGLFDARITTPLEQAGILNGELAAGDLGIAGAKVVVPGSPEKSILLRRLKDTGFFRMPPTQTHNEPSPILPVMEEWIRSLGPTNKINKG